MPEAVSSVMSVITAQITADKIAATLTGVGAVAIVLVFFWWGVRKVSQVIFSAFRSGKFRV